MSAKSSKLPVEGAVVPAPTFSYAQAAKGATIALSQPPSKPSGKPSSSQLDASENGANESEARHDLEKVESINKANVILAKPNTLLSDESKRAQKSTTPTSGSVSEMADQVSSTNTDYRPSSPSIASVSTSTLPKEDDMFITPNASSDSTWDKQSERSIMGDKPGNGDKEKDGEQEPENDVSPSLPPAIKELKAAPIPTVNIWEKRKEAQAAKLKSAHPHGFGGNKVASDKAAGSAVQTPVTEPKKDASSKKGSLLDGQANAAAATQARDKKRSAEGSAKSREEGSKKSTAKFERAPENQKLTGQRTVPPLVNDSASWPTPESARFADRKKAQEKADKVDKVEKEKPRYHGKEKWTPVPYVPNTVFNTPLPASSRRGGKTLRGGRESAVRGGSHQGSANASNEKPINAAAPVDAPKPVEQDDAAKPAQTTKKETLPNRPTRSNSVGYIPSSDKYEQSASSFGKRKQDSSTKQANRAENSMDASRRTTGPFSAESVSKSRQDQRFSSKRFEEHSFLLNHRASEGDILNQAGDSHSHPHTFERRGDASGRGQDHFRENTFSYRGEGRSERGRGGYRSRNGYSGSQSLGSHSSNGQSGTSHGTYTSAKYSFAERQSGQHGQRGRGGARTQSIPNNTYNRYHNPLSIGSTQMSSSPIDTHGVYNYSPIHPNMVTAMPYQPYAEQYALQGLVAMQLEYYFSVDNLCKDVFLRKHMDSQGYVFLSVIANFNRMKQLTQDLDMIRYVCTQSKNIEICVGPDGIDRLRQRQDWKPWVLNMNERDPSVQNDGPQQTFPILIRNVPDTTTETAYMNQLENGISPVTQYAMFPEINGNATDAHLMSVSYPVTATTDYSSSQYLVHDGKDLSPVQPVEKSQLPDQQVDDVVIVLRDGTKTTSQAGIEKHPDRLADKSASSKLSTKKAERADGVAEEVSTGANGNDEPTFDDQFLDQSLKCVNVSAPIFWVKDRDSPICSLPPNSSQTSYNCFRNNALQDRETSPIGTCPNTMDLLYQFWSHFLIHNFNVGMYSEFQGLAFEDLSRRKSSVGMRTLSQFYHAIITNQKKYSEELVCNLVDLLVIEARECERPIFQMLKSTWKKETINIQTRKRLVRFLNENIKAELER